MHSPLLLLVALLLVRCGLAKPVQPPGGVPMFAENLSSSPIEDTGINESDCPPALFAGLCDFMFLPQNSTIQEVAIKAAIRGQAKTIVDAIRCGASPNTTDPATGKPLLYHAIYSGSVRTVDRLITHGADLKWEDSEGFRLFEHAILRGSIGMARLLTYEGGCMWDLDEDLRSFYAPLARGDLAMIRMLLNGCSKEWTKTRRLVNEAISARNSRVLHYFLDQGVSPDGDQVRYDMSPLEQAIIAGWPRAVELLVLYGAKMVTRKGRSIGTFLRSQNPVLMMHNVNEMRSLHSVYEIQEYMEQSRMYHLKN